LQGKYGVELENHIRDISDKEESMLKVQKLQAEKKDLTWKVSQLATELRVSQ